MMKKNMMKIRHSEAGKIYHCKGSGKKVFNKSV